MAYNIWNAIAYEITNLLINHDPRWELNQWVQMIRRHCFPDWVEWKTERTMKNVDRQIAEIQDALQYEHEQKDVNPVIIEHTPDCSRAQDPFVGTLQI